MLKRKKKDGTSFHAAINIATVLVSSLQLNQITEYRQVRVRVQQQYAGLWNVSSLAAGGR